MGVGGGEGQVTLDYRSPIFYAGPSETLPSGNRLVYGGKGEVTGPATAETAGLPLP